MWWEENVKYLRINPINVTVVTASDRDGRQLDAHSLPVETAGEEGAQQTHEGLQQLHYDRRHSLH